MTVNSVISELPVIRPDWPAPVSVHAFTTTRGGGVSDAPWDTMNLGDHVEDSVEAVAINRRRLAEFSGLPADRFGWLNQVHGTDVVSLPLPHGRSEPPIADAVFTSVPQQVCTILTADCLPVLFCDQDGTRVAAAHAGWRGLSGSVLERTVRTLGHPETLMAWLGPAIGPQAFEVGPEVRDAFLAAVSEAEAAFTPEGARPGHFMADIYRLARQRLARAGVTRVYGGGFCTMADKDRFFSFRRDGRTGRMASLIWLD